MAAPEMTMLARLAGPVQSWGAEPTLRTATTHPTPTWSGLLGLGRAALGHGRTDPAEQIAWLRDLTMAIRVDAPGSVHVDFHTINPLPAAYERFIGVQTRNRGLVPIGTTVQSGGQAPRWLKGEAPMITRRHLIHDASFLWLVGGPAGDVDRLAAALAAPRWRLALQRLRCCSAPTQAGSSRRHCELRAAPPAAQPAIPDRPILAARSTSSGCTRTPPTNSRTALPVGQRPTGSGSYSMSRSVVTRRTATPPADTVCSASRHRQQVTCSRGRPGI